MKLRQWKQMVTDWKNMKFQINYGAILMRKMASVVCWQIMMFGFGKKKQQAKTTFFLRRKNEQTPDADWVLVMDRIRSEEAELQKNVTTNGAWYHYEPPNDDVMPVLFSIKNVTSTF